MIISFEIHAKIKKQPKSLFRTVESYAIGTSSNVDIQFIQKSFSPSLFRGSGGHSTYIKSLYIVSIRTYNQNNYQLNVLQNNSANVTWITTDISLEFFFEERQRTKASTVFHVQNISGNDTRDCLVHFPSSKNFIIIYKFTNYNCKNRS